MSARRKFLIEVGRAAAACVLMAACEQEQLAGPRRCISSSNDLPDPAAPVDLKDTYIVDGFTGLQLGTKDNPYSVRTAGEFDALLQFLVPTASLAVHFEGAFKTAAVYRWGQYASRNLGLGWTVDGDCEISIDPDAVATVDGQPLYCLAGPAKQVTGIRTRGNHSALADRWPVSLRTGGVLLESDGSIDGVTFSDFGSLGAETFVGIVTKGSGRAAITRSVFGAFNPSSSNTQVSVFAAMGMESEPGARRSFVLMEGNVTNAAGSRLVQAHTIYQSEKALVRGNRSTGADVFYYGDYYSTRGVAIEDNDAEQARHGVQLRLSQTPSEIAGDFSHEDYDIGPNRFATSGANVSINTDGPSTSTRYIRGIRVHESLSLETLGDPEVVRTSECRRAA